MGILHTSVNCASLKNGFETNTTSFTEDIIGCGCFPCVFEFLALIDFFQLELFSENVFTQNLQ
jgi:hypothetical protein